MSHFYDSGIPGIPPYPSVTTITSAILPEPHGLKMWKSRNSNWREELLFKAKIGTLVHYRILNRYSTSTLELPEFALSDFPKDAMAYVDIAESMFDDLKLDIQPPYYIEHVVLNHEHRYGGKMDMAAVIDGKLTIVDVKTSNYYPKYGIKDEYKIQLGGYHSAFSHNGEKAEAAAILHIHPFEEKNPELKAKLVPVKMDDVLISAERFFDLAREYHLLND